VDTFGGTESRVEGKLVLLSMGIKTGPLEGSSMEEVGRGSRGRRPQRVRWCSLPLILSCVGRKI